MMRTGLILALVLLSSACSTAALSSPIEFRRSGGIAGLNDALTIDAQGHATLARRTGRYEFDLSADERNRLTSALGNAGLASIPEDSLHKPLVPDEISYVVVYQNHSIKTSDMSLPDQLRPVVVLFNELTDRYGR